MFNRLVLITLLIVSLGAAAWDQKDLTVFGEAGSIDPILNSTEATFDFAAILVTAEIKINEGGGDNDCYIKGDNHADMFYTDASTDRVGIGTSSPDASLEVEGDVQIEGPVTINEDSGDFDVRIEGNGDANLFCTDAGNDRIGIGTATPSQKLSVSGTAEATAGLVVDTSTLFVNGTFNRVGVGTASPSSLLHIDTGAAASQAVVYLGGSNNDTGLIGFRNSTASSVNASISSGLVAASDGGNLKFATKTTGGSLTDRMTIAADGKVGVGTTSPSYMLEIAADAGASVELKVNGSIECTAVHETSDRCYKKNIKPISENSTARIKALEPVSFEWNIESNAEGKTIGLVAQDVELIIPEAVATDENGKKSIIYSKITTHLIKAVQEQQEKIEQLTTAVNVLIHRVEELEGN